MSDSDQGEKKTGIPSWQSSTTQDTLKEEEKPAPDSPSREQVLEQAKRFLEEDEVKDASTDKKIAFLEGKGLNREEIHNLLGVSRNKEASSSTSSPSPSQTSHPSQPQIQTESPPPIITYPEFLTTPTSPSPLITKPRLLTTLYAFSALSFLLYGTNTYLVTPMISSLTESRISLASTASTNLQKLIKKLEGAVSTIPSELKDRDDGKRNGDGKGEESEDEDPTELFHRDIGIQTTPSLVHSRSHSQSSSSTTSSSDNTTEKVITTQTMRLTTLSTKIKSLLENSTSEGDDVAELETTIGVLKEFLEGMAYVAPSYSYGVYGGGYSGSGGSSGEKDDEIAKVKAGIRGVKRVLLSARSFPGGVRAGAGR